MAAEAGPRGLPVVRVADRAGWRAWLAEHHASSSSVWLVMPKGDAKPFDYDDVVEEALCFGWVDGQVQRLDERSYLMLLAPRKAGSGWARTNQQRVARLEAAGLMTAAGRAKVEAAKADGSWTLLDAVEDGIVPDDLAAAVDPEAWEALTPGVRKLALYRVYGAKRAETRAKRISEIVGRIARGEPPVA